MRFGPAWLAVLLATGVASAAPRDIPKADPAVVNLVNDAARWTAQHESVRPRILALGKAEDDAARSALVDALVKEGDGPALEVLVRYREPALVPVFARLLASDAWYVRRLAIFGLQRTFGYPALDGVVARLEDENALVREIAATTIAILHEAAQRHKDLLPRDEAVRAALKGLKARTKADRKALEARLAREEDAFVRAALEAAIDVLGTRRLLRLHVEPTVQEAPGRYVPRLEGGQVNAHQQGSGVASAGSGRIAPTSAWGYPVLLYPHEVLSLTSDEPLVPLPAKGGSFHYGHDCGWFLEGSGVYAIADGVVRWIRSGGDWGGLIVVEHMDQDKTKVVALNGHCGMWAFVKGGESVRQGQLLGQMGLSFSAENGGHGAHDHFGLYTGGFSEGHCYGRGAQDRTAEGWLVPADFLTPKVEGQQIPAGSYR